MARTILISEVERRRRRKYMINAAFRYTLLTAVALVMIYPIIWLVGATFKTNNEIFTSINFIPSKIDFTPYINGWKTRTKFTFTTFFLNTFSFVIPKILFCLISSTLVAYGFARFNFPLKKDMFLHTYGDNVFTVSRNQDTAVYFMEKPWTFKYICTFGSTNRICQRTVLRIYADPVYAFHTDVFG